MGEKQFLKLNQTWMSYQRQRLILLILEDMKHILEGQPILVQISKFLVSSLILIQILKNDGCTCTGCNRPYIVPNVAIVVLSETIFFQDFWFSRSSQVIFANNFKSVSTLLLRRRTPSAPCPAQVRTQSRGEKPADRKLWGSTPTGSKNVAPKDLSMPIKGWSVNIKYVNILIS